MMHPVNPNQQITVADTDALRAYYEELLRTNPNNLPAVYYLGIWHLERQSYQQVLVQFGSKIWFQSFFFIGKAILWAPDVLKSR
jgi:hypothetical protein